MRMHNLHGTEKEKEGEESSDEESDEEEEEDEDKKPQMELAMMAHYGAINRVRVRRVSYSISDIFKWTNPFSPLYQKMFQRSEISDFCFLIRRRPDAESSRWLPCGRRRDR